MKTKDEMITELLEVIDDVAETVEDYIAIDPDFSLIDPIVEQLREELVSLSESE